ncbi:TPM domain-containing protein [Flavobacterium sp. ANB]|uniref:TPM domain-containing protein n=1 Tax=unclassified Flavobacterium TaxID=196869 RepID=UPI0012B82939|nr:MULTISPECIES: TPM domain-containing protein [unclassified Flavobacterium]MBF4518253.1 TPM domain-containing protein [Flavobacterium sp. ANB]MTD71049.1 TPM domain-containing protein [Flavobacterium sp. LC2016-13]
MKKIFFIITVTLFSANLFFAQTKKVATSSPEIQNAFPKSFDNVNDFEKILTPNQNTTLETTLKAFYKKAFYNIIIVTISSTKPYKDFQEYTQNLDNYLANDLKLDPTILIVLSKELRQVQVLGVQLISYKLNDDQTKEIIATYAVPEFKKGDYYKGLEDACAQLIKKLQ